MNVKQVQTCKVVFNKRARNAIYYSYEVECENKRLGLKTHKSKEN